MLLLILVLLLVFGGGGGLLDLSPTPVERKTSWTSVHAVAVTPSDWTKVQ